MKAFRIPIYEIEDSTDDQPLHIGLGRLLDPDGNELVWPTVGPFRIETAEDQLTTLTVTFAVRVRVVPPKT